MSSFTLTKHQPPKENEVLTDCGFSTLMDFLTKSIYFTNEHLPFEKCSKQCVYTKSQFSFNQVSCVVTF